MTTRTFPSPTQPGLTRTSSGPTFTPEIPANIDALVWDRLSEEQRRRLRGSIISPAGGNPGDYKASIRDGQIVFTLKGPLGAAPRGATGTSMADPVSELEVVTNRPAGGGDIPESVFFQELDPGQTQGSPQQLTQEQILQALRSGAVTREDALAALTNLYKATGTGTALGGGPAALAEAIISSISPATPTGGGDALGGATSTPTVTDSPTNFIDLAEQIGVPDVARGFALRSGVAPAFQDFVAGRAARSLFPFQVQALTSGEALEPGESLGDIVSTRAFEDFLNRQQQAPSIGQALRSAADFLRTPSIGVGQGAVPSAQQEALRSQLLGREGTIGAELFDPTIDLAVQAAQGRGRSTVNVGGAVRRSLENVLAADPLRFQTAPSFIDFLAQQGIF